MPLETATFPSDLVTSNPAASDGMNNADDHMRLIKAVLQTTLAGVNAALTRVIGTSFGFLSGDGGSPAPSYSFTNEPTLGFYRSLPGIMAYTGVLRSSNDAGRVFMHAGTTVPAGALFCNGAAVSRTTYADLFTAIGTTWGAGDGSTTFNLPDLRDRFPRAAGTTYSGAVGTLQASQNQSHTHVVSGTTAIENATHTHAFAGTSAFMTTNQSHTHSYNNSNAASGGVTGGGSFGLPVNDSAGTTGSTNIDHQHTFSGTTAAEGANHAHTFSVTSSTGSADGTETRPMAATLLFCIRY